MTIVVDVQNEDIPAEDDAAVRQYSREEYQAELSPAQPDDAETIVDDANAPDGAPAHTKHDRGGRMSH